MRLSEIKIDPNIIVEKYPRTQKVFDTKQILHDLYEIRDQQITSPLKYGASAENFGTSKFHIQKDIEGGNFELKNTNPRLLITDQRWIDVETLIKAMRNPSMGRDDKYVYDQYPIAIESHGKFYLMDGNHRATAALYSNRLLPTRCIQASVDKNYDMEPF